MISSSSLTQYTYISPHGPIRIQASDRGITAIAFGTVQLEGKEIATALTNKAASQIQEYLAGKRKEFALQLDMRGTSFQKTVWSEVCNIPYGQLLNASDIASRIGKPGSYRSVGTAIKQCTLAPLVPIHRIENTHTRGEQAKLFRAFMTLERKVLSSS